MPPVAQRLPLPRQLWAEGVRRYGYHGLSYESIVRALGAEGTRGRMIVAHLGNGSSLAAIRDGTSVDTTMGLTPLGGLMMGTRPGDLDPGVLLYLLRERGYTPQDLNETVTERSGLLGVSNISADMRTLLERRADDVAAAQAVELFVYQAKKHIGSLVAVLGGSTRSSLPAVSASMPRRCAGRSSWASHTSASSSIRCLTTLAPPSFPSTVRASSHV